VAAEVGLRSSLGVRADFGFLRIEPDAPPPTSQQEFDLPGFLFRPLTAFRPYHYGALGTPRMNSNVRNLLYRNPQFYEVAYPEPNEETPMMCRRMFSRYLSQPPRSILDLGCGTARDLDSLSRECPDCWGVDCLHEAIEFAKARRPHLHLEVGDMSTLRLGRTFDVIMCMGSAFMYALRSAEVAGALDTFAAHSHSGTVLILDINNAASYLGGEHFKRTSELRLSSPQFTAEAFSTYDFDRRRQLLVRRRKWKIQGCGEVEDFCEYRMFFPAELEYVLEERGFQVAGMFDNMQLQETELCGPRLYVPAIFQTQNTCA
jgi:SAM-dependent methyltransferase